MSTPALSLIAIPVALYSGKRMVTRDFSGMEIVKVLGNAGNFAWVRTTGDHAIMKWTAPPDHDTDDRTVSVPLHDHVQTGTLRNIFRQRGNPVLKPEGRGGIA